MVFRKLLFLFLIFPSFVISQELTETDITTIADFDAKKISVFGLSLGMNSSDAIKIIKENPKLSFKEEDWHNDGSYRIYVYHSEVTESDKCILYLIWWNKQKNKMSSLTVFRKMKQFLIGETKEMLTVKAIDSTSTLTKEFLHVPDSSAVTADMSFIGYRATSYYYFSKGIIVVKQVDSYKDYTGEIITDGIIVDGKMIKVVFYLTDFSEPKKKS